MADRPHLEKQHSSKPADEGSAKALSGHEIQLKMMDNERRLSKYTADADDGEDDEPERRQSTLANVLVSNMNFTKSKAPGKLGPKMAEKFAGKMLGAVHRRLALAQFKKMLCHGILVKHVTVKGKEAHLTFYATHEWTGIKYFSDAKHGCRKRGPAERKFFFAEMERIVAAAAAGPPAEHPLLKTLRLAPEDYAKTAVIEFADGTGLACLCASPLYCKIVVEGLNLCLSNLDADGCLVASAHDGTLKSRKRNVSERMHLHQLHHLYHPHKHPNVSRVQPIDIGTMVEVMHVNAGKNDGAYVTSVRLPDTAGELQSYELTLNDNPLFKRGQYIRGHVLDYDAEADTYDIAYFDGPYDADDLLLFPVTRPQLKDGECLLVGVARNFITVDYADQVDTRFPVFILLATAVQIAIFVHYANSRGGATATEPLAGPEHWYYRIIGSRQQGCMDMRSEWWRNFTYQFCHFGGQHIGFNAFMQLLFGIPIEIVHGPLRMFFIYQLGVGVGALTCSVIAPYTAVVGASGGVYCIFGMHAGNLLINWDSMKHGLLNRWVRLLFMLSFIALDVIQYHTAHSGGTSYAAHLGGFGAGMCIGAVVLHNLESEWYERKILQPMAGVALLLYAVYAVVKTATQWPPEPYWGEEPCCRQLLDCPDLEPGWFSSFSCRGEAGHELKIGGAIVETCAAMLQGYNTQQGITA